MISYITVNYNQLEATFDLIKSIVSYAKEPFEIILVDNDSSEDPFPRISSLYPTVTCIQAGGNVGFARGNNIGVEAAKGDYLFFVNNDTEITPGLDTTLLHCLNSHPSLGAVSPMICFFPARDNLDQWSDSDVIQYVGTTEVHPITARNNTPGLGKTVGEYFPQGIPTACQPTAYLHGAAMMVPRRTIDSVGLMAENFFLYYEELDWSARMTAAGYTLAICPQARIYHKESLSVGASSPLKTFYMNRNRILFMKRNYKERGLLLYYSFLWLITVPKNVLIFSLTGRNDLAKAFWRGVRWNWNPTAIGDPYKPKPRTKEVASKKMLK